MIKCVHQVCLWCACEMHEQCMTKHSRAKCVKHTTNDQNMLSMHKHGNPKKFELNGVQNNEKKYHIGILSNTFECIHDTCI